MRLYSVQCVSVFGIHSTFNRWTEVTVETPCTIRFTETKAKFFHCTLTGRLSLFLHGVS